MTPAMRRYRHADLRLRIARAQLLLGLAAGDRDSCLTDLLTFAGQIGDCTAADTLAAFRASLEDVLRAAQRELDRLER
jgi:hypothetical protein